MMKRNGYLVAALAGAAATVTAQRTRDNPCRSVALQQEESLEELSSFYESDIIFAGMDAREAYECVTSVPLDASDAAAMIDVLRGYLDFQTTLVFNKDPPESYQQPAIDVRARLDRLSDEVEDGQYENQYDFDVALQNIIQSVHDGHFSLDLGVYGLFAWLLPETLVSVSSDGQALPQVYARSDILGDVDNASPIVEIEGDDVFTYLADYVNRTGVPGYIEPHADWNHLTWNAAQEFALITAYLFTISRAPNNFQMTRVYNGESLSGRFANGSSFEWAYQAGSMMPLSLYEYTDPETISDEYVYLQSGSGFGKRSDSSYERKSTNRNPVVPSNDVPRAKLDYSSAKGRLSASSGSSSSTFNSINGRILPDQFPTDANITQRNLGYGGYITGYILDEESVGVLSIPSFLTGYGDASDPGSAVSFTEAVADFISEAKAANVGKVILDLSGNTGGTILQGIDTFKQFFPDAEPPVAVRGAASPNHNTLGRLLTRILDDGDSLFTGSQPVDFTGLEAFIALVTTVSTDVEGDSWDSYDDFFGPIEYNGGNFTNVTRYDLDTEEIAEPMGQNVTGYGDNDNPRYEQPFAAEDIILLHDGTCASTCALFVDLMKNHAGVRSVVAGGVPQHGPMQAVSGTRGSNTVTIDMFDLISADLRSLSRVRGFADLLESEGLTEDDIDNLPPSLSDAPWAIRIGAVNTLDIVRPDSDEPGVPYQFAYEAAHCRLFYTAAMMRDITVLWRAVATYANGDEDICVPDSTGGFGLRANDTFVDDPGFDGEEVWENANSTTVLDNGNAPEHEAGDGSSSGGGGNDNSDGEDGGDDDSASSSLSSSFLGLVMAMGVALMMSL